MQINAEAINETLAALRAWHDWMHAGQGYLTTVPVITDLARATYRLFAQPEPDTGGPRCGATGCTVWGAGVSHWRMPYGEMVWFCLEHRPRPVGV